MNNENKTNINWLKVIFENSVTTPYKSRNL